MPILRIKEIRDMSKDDRQKRIGDLRTELLRLKTMIGAGGTIENPARVKQLRRAIAKVLTVSNEEKLGITKPKARPKAKPKPKPKLKPRKAKKEKDQTKQESEKQ